MENKYLQCPNCQKNIRLEEWFEHNTQVFNEFIDDKVNQKLETELTKKINLEKIKIEKEYLEKSRNNDLKYQEKISNLQLEINNWENKNKALLTQKDSEILMREKDVQLNYEQKLKEYEIRINEAKTLEDKLKAKFDTEIAQNLLVKEKEYNEMTKIFQQQITDLEKANLQYRVIHSKTKGENFENEVEGELQKAFGYYDKITKITTGDKKADYLQIVRNPERKEIGKIVYEVKNAKWSDTWLPKLSVDVANNKTKYGILVATSFNDKYKNIPFIRSDEWNNIWLTDPESFIFVGQVLRRIIEIEAEYEDKRKLLLEGDDTEILKKYEAKMFAIDNFVIEELPKFVRSFKKQLEELDKVKGSLYKNADTLAKTHTILKDKVEKEIIKKLQTLTGVVADISYDE